MTTHDTQTPEKLETLRTVAHAATGDPERYPCRERWSRYHHALQAAYEDGHLVVKSDAEPLSSSPVDAQISPDAGINTTAVSVKPLVDALLRQHEIFMRSKGRNPIDYTSKWRQAADTLASLPPTPTEEASHG